MNRLIGIMVLFSVLLSGDLFAKNLEQKESSSQKFTYYGSYTTKLGSSHIEWDVVIIPKKAYGKEELINLSKELYLKYNNRIKIFDDTKYLKQYIARDKYFNDKSEKKVPYPETWAKKHYLACVTCDILTKQWAININADGTIGIDLESWPERKIYLSGSPVEL